MKKPVVIAIALVALVAAAAAFAQGPDLEKRVQDLLMAKLGDDAKTIKVAVVKDEVVLTGEVAARSTKEHAKEVALAVAGVKKVDNQVVAKGEKKLLEGGTKQEMDDSKIELAVEKKVKGELGDHYKGVSIEVVDGVALIRGKVPDDARHQLAIKAMTGTEGVKKVIDLLKVGK